MAMCVTSTLIMSLWCTSLSSPTSTARQARWLEHLAELNLEVHYVPGKDNVVADVLSRLWVACGGYRWSSRGEV